MYNIALWYLGEDTLNNSTRVNVSTTLCVWYFHFWSIRCSKSTILWSVVKLRSTSCSDRNRVLVPQTTAPDEVSRWQRWWVRAVDGMSGLRLPSSPSSSSPPPSAGAGCCSPAGGGASSSHQCFNLLLRSSARWDIPLPASSSQQALSQEWGSEALLVMLLPSLFWFQLVTCSLFAEG